MYCKRCQYDLRGTLEARCSECGADFDPADPSTFLETRSQALLRRTLVFLACLGPFVLVVITICIEFIYASIPRNRPSPDVQPPFYRCTLCVELALLSLALFNVPLMSWHLSASHRYSCAKGYVKAVLALTIAFAYLVMVLAAMLFVLMMHDW